MAQTGHRSAGFEKGDANMILKEVSDRARAQLAVGVVAFALGYDPGEMIDELRRTKRNSTARHLAMYLAYTAFEMSLSRCAAAFGRDRSTVSHACRAVEDRREEAAFDQWIDGLELSLKSLAPFAPDGMAAI